MIKKTIAFIGLAIAVSTNSNAAIIVDTGPGPVNVGGVALGDGQSLAGEFTIGQQYTITDVEGWIGDIGFGGSTATVAIYTDGGSIPGTELFSAGFSVGATDAWYGASGLSWLLDAGTYWVSYEVRAGDTLDGYMPGPAPSPLGAYAYTTNGDWFSDPLNIGVRISSVPIPAAAWLFGSALLGLSVMKRRKA